MLLNQPYDPEDDFEDYSQGPKRKFSLKTKLIALSLASVIGYSLSSTTLAGNITINSGRVEFGQGLSQTTACDQDLTITPYATFANASATTGSYKFTQIKVTNIGSSCYGKDFLIKAFDSVTASAALTLYQTGGTTNYDYLKVYDNNGTFELVDAGLLSGDISNISGGFVVTMYNSGSPQSLAKTPAGNVYKFTIESLEHSGTPVSLPSGSLSFTTTSQILEYAANNTFILGTDTFTVDLWANVTNSANQTFYDAGGDVNSTGGFAFWIESGELKLRTNGVGHDVQISMDASWIGSYHHYAAVRGNGYFRAYVDGVKKLELADSGYNITRNNPTVGQLNNFRSYYVLNGNLRNLRVVKGTALYNANFTPAAAPLSKVTGTILLLLAQYSGDPYKDSSDYGWVTTTTGSALPAYVAAP
jgi:hypothetical protein